MHYEALPNAIAVGRRCDVNAKVILRLARRLRTAAVAGGLHRALWRCGRRAPQVDRCSPQPRSWNPLSPSRIARSATLLAILVLDREHVVEPAIETSGPMVIASGRLYEMHGDP